MRQRPPNPKHEKYAVLVYNLVTSSSKEEFSELPEVAQSFLKGLYYEDMIIPLVVNDHQRGRKNTEIARKYATCRHKIASIIRKNTNVGE